MGPNPSRGRVTDAIEDDLLQPVLGPEADLRRYRRPFDPSSLTYAAFFCGPLSAGVLFALNWPRLGVSRFLWRTLVLFLLVFALSSFGSALWLEDVAFGTSNGPSTPVAAGTIRSDDTRSVSAVGLGRDRGVDARSEELRARIRDAASLDRFLRRVAAILPAVWVARRQGRRFRAYDMHDGKPSAVFWWALALGIAEFFAAGALTRFALGLFAAT